MTHQFTSLQDLFEHAGKIASSPAEKIEKEAEEVDATEALSGELYAGGGIIAEGFVDRALEKIAASIPVAGGGWGGPRSTMESIADQIANRRGKNAKVGDDTSIRAEDTGYKGHGSDRALSGKTEKPNPMRSVPKSKG